MKLSRRSAALNIDDRSSKIASLLLSVLLPLCYRNAIPPFTSCSTQNKLASSFFLFGYPKTCLMIKMLLVVKSSGGDVITMQYRCF